VGTNKVKGYLPLEDVVQVMEETEEDPQNVKFTIICVGKALVRILLWSCVRLRSKSEVAGSMVVG
jgi:hypothetical protein